MKMNWNKNMGLKQNWIYSLLFISVILAVMALATSNFIYKSGTAGMGIIILLILFFKNHRNPKDSWFIIASFMFSIVGDWFLSHKNGDELMFVKGIAFFFLAHLGYMVYATVNGKINWKFTGILLTLFLGFFFIILYPSISDKILMSATLIYLLVSCLSLGAAVGIKADLTVKRAFILGVFLILFSDTIISLTEFLGYKNLDFLILPTYYLAHISITFALIRKSELKH